MRALILPAAALLIAAAVVLGGARLVEAPLASRPGDLTPAVASVQAPPADTPRAAAPPVASSTAAAQVESGIAGVAPPAEAPAGPVPSRLVAPAIVAPPLLAPEELQREAPRAPLSQLSLALPPQPKANAGPDGAPFFRPVAIESAVFQSAGRTIAIAGVTSLPPDRSCTHDGASWPCGARARTAFRLWLRGRALMCRLPDEAGEVTAAACSLAKQDVGAWLVENGWALAAPDGPYKEAEAKARAAGLGIFGLPPDASTIGAVPDLAPSAPVELQPIMTEDGQDLAAPADPRMAFPPPPD